MHAREHAHEHAGGHARKHAREHAREHACLVWTRFNTAGDNERSPDFPT